MKVIIQSIFTIAGIMLSGFCAAQNYTSYFTGDVADVGLAPAFGMVLMGGAGEDDEAMKWFLQRANGGDVVVIRTSGSDGYNDYLYSDLGIDVNSVETIVFENALASNDSYVIQQLQNAEAIWIAGGSQAAYVSMWRNTPVEEAINHLLLVKGGVVGGTSAGMAIMAGRYFGALNGTITSGQALTNPYNSLVTIGHNDFVSAPFLHNTLTDTHFDNPDRRGRMAVFMARLYTDQGIVPTGIACDEYAAVCIGSDGIAQCYGEAPQYDDNVYFVRPNCLDPIGPETCISGSPLTWDRGGEALKIYRIKATSDGSRTFDLNNWLTGSGGEWLNWSVQSGTFNESIGATAPDCSITEVQEFSENSEELLYPNPTSGLVTLPLEWIGKTALIYSSDGRLVHNRLITESIIDLRNIPPGFYLIMVEQKSFRLVKE